MRKFTSFVVFVFLIGLVMYIIINNENIDESIDEKMISEREELPQLKTSQEKKGLKDLFKGDVFSFIDMTDNEVLEELGEPLRKDLSPYGYTWWIYTDGLHYQIQIGIEDNRVQTVFATGEVISTEPFQIGKTIDQIQAEFPFQNKLTYQSGLSFYSFLLNETDINMNPLIKVSDDIFVQLYIDTFTAELSSIRIVKGDVLVRHKVYEMEYRGPLPEDLQLTAIDWKKVEKGAEQQIFDLTNIYRNRFGVTTLIYDEQVKEAAYRHSKEMFEENYFSHYSLDGSGLKERLEENTIYYLSAGENIAAQHMDGPAAVEGWLNSEGHREALLHEEYTHLGVGVHQLYYTQNFLLKP